MPELKFVLDMIARNTVGVLTAAPERKEEWFEAMRQNHGQAQAADDTQMVNLLGAVLELLQGASFESLSPDLEGAYADCWQYVKQGLENPPETDPLKNAVLAYVKAGSPQEQKELVEQQQAYLFTSEADQLMAVLLEQYADDQDLSRKLEHHRALLGRCREIGIDQAFAETLEAAEQQAQLPDELRQLLGELAQSGVDIDSPQDLERLAQERPDLYQRLEAVNQAAASTPLARFLQADNWAESRRIVSRHPELLDGGTDQQLAAMMEAARAGDDQAALEHFQEHRALLNSCREIGIDQAFAQKMGV